MGMGWHRLPRSTHTRSPPCYWKAWKRDGHWQACTQETRATRKDRRVLRLLPLLALAVLPFLPCGSRRPGPLSMPVPVPVASLQPPRPPLVTNACCPSSPRPVLPPSSLRPSTLPPPSHPASPSHRGASVPCQCRPPPLRPRLCPRPHPPLHQGLRSSHPPRAGPSPSLCPCPSAHPSTAAVPSAATAMGTAEAWVRPLPLHPPLRGQ